MVQIQCDEIKVGEGKLTTVKEIRNYNDLTCCFDVDYEKKLEECFYLILTFCVKIKSDGVDRIMYSIPFTLAYSIKKYKEFSMVDILKSAVIEVQDKANDHFRMIVSIYYLKKVELEENR